MCVHQRIPSKKTSLVLYGRALLSKVCSILTKYNTLYRNCHVQVRNRTQLISNLKPVLPFVNSSFVSEVSILHKERVYQDWAYMYMLSLFI